MKKFVDEILVFAFAATVYLSVFVVNGDVVNRGAVVGFSWLIILFFAVRLLIWSGTLTGFKTLLGLGLGLILMLAGLFEAGLGLLQLYGFQASNHGLFRLTGTFFNPGPFGGFLAVATPAAANFLAQGRKVKGEMGGNFTFYPALFTLLVILLVLPAAMSRASWIAAIVGCGVVLVKKLNTDNHGVFRKIKIRINQFNRHYLRTVIIACFAAVILSGSGIYFMKKDSADGRLLTWKIALLTAVKHPLGVGPGNFSGAYGDEQAAYFASGRASATEEHVAGSPEYGFNEYLQIAVESGIVALILFVMIVFRTFKSLFKYNAGLAGAFAALLVFAAFSYPFSLWEFLVIATVLIGVGSGGDKTLEGTSTLTGFKTLLGLAIVLFLYQKPVREANKTWQRLAVYYHSGLYQEFVEACKPIEKYLDDRPEFMFEYGRSLSMSEHYEESNAVLQRAIRISCDPMFYNIMGNNHKALNDNEKAEQCYLKAAHIVPNRLYPRYLLMKLYSETGQQTKAVETAKIVLTKEPKVQSEAVREMREEAREIWGGE